MKYNIVSYLIGEGFKNILKNKKSTASSLVIMCLVMLVFGAFFLIGENNNYIMSNVENAQAIQVFFKKDVTDDQAKKVGDIINKINGVNKIEFISKADAYNTVKTTVLENPNLAEGFEESFPPSYIVTFTDLSLKDSVKNEIDKIDIVDDITSSDETIETLMNLTKGIRIATFIILVILIIFSIFIISNAIKMAVYSRRKEISIMKYVGATNSFIRWPFIVEGILIGVMSALISILLVGITYNLVINGLTQTDLVQKIGTEFVKFGDILNMILVVYLGLGSGIGIIGSSLSMRKYLDV